jgi:hypothetical protein
VAAAAVVADAAGAGVPALPYRLADVVAAPLPEL